MSLSAFVREMPNARTCDQISQICVASYLWSLKESRGTFRARLLVSVRLLPGVSPACHPCSQREKRESDSDGDVQEMRKGGLLLVVCEREQGRFLAKMAVYKD